MKHLNVYRACPWLWQLIGHTYREIDVVSSVLFLIGYAGVTVISYLRLERVGRASVRNAVHIACVSLFLVAQTMLELRAVYSRLWERFHLRPSWRYLAGVGLFIYGSSAFVVALGFDMDGLGAYGKTVGYLAFSGSLAFVLGSALLIIDAVRQSEGPVARTLLQPYALGSVFFFVGSSLFLAGSVCNTDVGTIFDGAVPKYKRYKEDTACSADFVHHTFGLGAAFLATGSFCFLLFAIDEMRTMYKGPDPRSVAHHGREVPHPAHHEDYHLVRTIRSSSQGRRLHGIRSRISTAGNQHQRLEDDAGSHSSHGSQGSQGSHGSQGSQGTEPGVAAHGSKLDGQHITPAPARLNRPSTAYPASALRPPSLVAVV